MTLPAVIVDTREQRPWDFPGVVTVRSKLTAGDYSLLGYEERIGIERKSLDDLIQTMTKGKDRFRRELAVMQRMTYAAVVVESGLPALLQGKYESSLDPITATKMVAGICAGWEVPVFFAGNRGCAARIALALMASAKRVADGEKQRDPDDPARIEDETTEDDRKD